MFRVCPSVRLSVCKVFVRLSVRFATTQVHITSASPSYPSTDYLLPLSPGLRRRLALVG